MATPELFTFEIETSTDGAPVSPFLRTFGIEAANIGQPAATARVRTFEVEASLGFLPPDVTLDNPTTGPITGIISMEATSTDPNAGGSITQVEFLVNGIVVNTDTTAPYQYNYDTSVLSDGAHNFQARSTNAAGLTTTTPVLNLLVDNSPPIVSLDSPTTGPITSDQLLEASASDAETGITLVEFLVDGSPVGSDATAPYNFLLDTTGLTDGSHDFSVRATNGVGLQTTTTPVSIVVDNSPPTVNYLQPLAGPVGGEITLEADAEDLESGIERVEFLVDGAIVGTDFIPNSPYSVLFNTIALPNGLHNFQARAFNNAGLSTTTPINSLLVNNAAPAPPPSLVDCDSVQEPVSDKAVRARYLYRALTNFLDLLPEDDREVLSRLWGGLQQISEDFYLQLYQNYDSKNIFEIPVFRRSRWNEVVLVADAEPAQILSSIEQTTYDTSTATGDNTLTFYVDGNQVSVVFTDTAANSLSNVLAEINSAAAIQLSRPNIIVANNIGFRITLQSINAGTDATISIDSTNGNIPLGFYPGVSAVGVGVSTRAEPAQLVGSTVPALVDTSIATGEPTLAVQVDGSPTQVINFPDDASVTIIAIVNAINAQIPGLATLNAQGRLLLTSPTTTCGSRVEIPAGGGNSQLGFADGDFSIGCGAEVSEIFPEYPVSYEIRIGTAGEDLRLVPFTDPSVMSFPTLRSRIDSPRVVLGQADQPHLGLESKETDFGTSLDDESVLVDCNDVSGWSADGANLVECAFIVRNGRIHFNRNVDAQLRALCLDILWAEDVYRNDTYLKDNFGFPIQYERDNSIEYKNVLQGLHSAYWEGPEIEKAEIGLNLLFDLPTAPATGRIDSIAISQNPQLVGIQASEFFDVRDANRTFSFTIDGVFIFVVFDPTNSVPDAGPDPSHQNYPAIDGLNPSVVKDINDAAIAAGLGYAPASVIAPDPLQPDVVQVVLSGQQSVRIDTVTGNAAIGFPPGEVAFGLTDIVIDGETFQISTEFPVTKQVGDFVERLDPLTDGVEFLDYVSDPIWWEVFGLATLDSQFNLADGYTEDDLKLINEILKYHLFGVKIIPDAFNRLGNIEFGVVTKFINDIKPISKTYILLIPFMLLDVFSVTDDSTFDGRPDDVETFGLVFPPNLDVPPYNLLEFAANQPPPTNQSFSDSYPLPGGGWTRDAVVAGTSPATPDFLDMDAYEIHLVNGGSVRVIAGGYSPAEVIPAGSGPFDFSSPSMGSFNITINGQNIVVNFGAGANDIPMESSVSPHVFANAVNTAMAAVATGFGEVLVTPDQRLVFRAGRFDGMSPTLEIPSAWPEFGLGAPTGVLVGTGGTLSDEVPF